MKEITLTQTNFKAEVLEQKGYVLVDFWASWCQPCKMLSPIVHQIAEEHADIKVGKVNVDEEMGLAMAFQISSIPALILFKDGQPVANQVGYVPKEVIEKMWK